jgi:hypothetical protein
MGIMMVETEKVCAQCGKHCAPAQSYCPKCGSLLPSATPAILAPSASSHRIILNRGDEERTLDAASIEEAFQKASPWVAKGFIARILDEQGIVRWTQALSNQQITVFEGDATKQRPGSRTEEKSTQLTGSSRKPWWRFW